MTTGIALGFADLDGRLRPSTFASTLTHIERFRTSTEPPASKTRHFGTPLISANMETSGYNCTSCRETEESPQDRVKGLGTDTLSSVDGDHKILTDYCAVCVRVSKLRT